MTRGGALRVPLEESAEAELLTALLYRASEAAGGLIDQGLAGRPAHETLQLAQAYEAALLVNFSPSEVAVLRRLLLRVEASARRLSSR